VTRSFLSHKGVVAENFEVRSRGEAPFADVAEPCDRSKYLISIFEIYSSNFYG
jgi:hypothetical protein